MSFIHQNCFIINLPADISTIEAYLRNRYNQKIINYIINIGGTAYQLVLHLFKSPEWEFSLSVEKMWLCFQEKADASKKKRDTFGEEKPTLLRKKVHTLCKDAYIVTEIGPILIATLLLFLF